MSEATKTKKAPYTGPKTGGGPYKGKSGQKTRGSKYAKKGKPAQAVKPLDREAPVFEYPCECHGLPAVKKPCEHTAEDRQDKKFSQSTLGTWSCSVTKKKCKVGRNKAKPVEETADEGTA